MRDGWGQLPLFRMMALDTVFFSPKNSKICSDKLPLDEQALRKKISRTFDETARTLLGSLLLYVSEHKDGPQRAEDREHKASRTPQPQEAGPRPTRFQLLQAKFMGTGREPHLKRTREVGRLISKDKQGPGRSLVSATINKLLEKTKEGGSSPGQRRPASEKSRWGPHGGKSTVKNILKKFLAAEEKEAKEKEAREKSPAQCPKTTRPLPRVMGSRSSVLTKLRERFEQSGCLHAEAGVLPLHREGRKSKSQQKKKVHRPEVRVLHTATMATSCTRTPPIRFLACTAEPLPALNIATIVCGPQSWLSHCAKISHLDSRRWPKRETRVSPDLEGMEPSGNKTLGSLTEEPKKQLKSPKSSMPQAEAQGDRHLALDMECISQPDSSYTYQDGKALSSCVSILSTVEQASLRGAGQAGEDRTAGPKAQGEADHSQKVKEGAGEVPEVTTAVCSSEDETERTPPDTDREQLFTMQKYLPEQEVEAWIPLLDSAAVQATRRAQPAIQPAQITVQLPIVHKMPAPAAPLPRVSSHEDKHSHVFGGDDVIENTPVAFLTGTEARRGHQTSARLVPGILGTAAEQGSRDDLTDAAGVDGDVLQMDLTPKPLGSSLGRQGNQHGAQNSSDLRSHSGVPTQSTSELSWEKHLLSESNKAPTPNKRASSIYPTASEHCLRGGTSRPGPCPVMQVPSQSCMRPESSTRITKSTLNGQKECKRPMTVLASPLRTAQENSRHDLNKNTQCSSDELLKASIKASRVATATSAKMPWPGGTQGSEQKIMLQPDGTQDGEPKVTPWPGAARGPEHNITAHLGGTQGSEHKIQPDGTQDPENKTMPQPAGARNPEHKRTPRLGGTRDPEHKIGEELAGLEEEDGALVACYFVAKGNGLVGEGLLQEPGSHRVLATSKSSKHTSGATERSVLGDTARHQPLAWAAPTARSEEAGNSCLVPDDPRLCASTKSAVSKHSAAVGRRKAALEGDPVHESMVSQSPQKSPSRSPGHSPDQPQLPSEGPQAQDRKHLTAEQRPPSRAAFSVAHSTGPIVREEARQVEPQGSEPLPLHQWAEGRAAPEAKSLGNGAQERRPAQVDLEPPQCHPKLEEAGMGHMSSHQAGQQDGSAQSWTTPLDQKAMLGVTELQAHTAQDLARDEKMPAVENPSQHKVKAQDHTWGPGWKVRSPTQGGDPQAVKNPATPEKPKKPGNLAVQGQAQGQRLTNSKVSQVQEQPDRTVEGTPTAGVHGEHPRPALRVCSQGNAGAQHPTLGSRPLTGDGTAVSLLEPADNSAWPTPVAGGHQSLRSPAQEGLPDTPGPERELSDVGRRRKSAHFAKYKAQSFRDQRDFELSFRSTVLRATDPLEPPK
uniref:Uncharacterized protein LOC109686933 isoform X2 n=1 Tax=Castor canadensis TaxID=51338 RepID=A0A8B7UPG5_CASCN|nr:uncharacterized protein LOC109686933 isoform X2 [Castor canadensis]